MIKILIAILIICFPINALASLNCCQDGKSGVQTEKPCHGSHQDSKKEAKDTCSDCAFCAAGSFFMHLPKNSLTMNSISLIQNQTRYFITNSLYPMFKPPKSQ